MSVVDVESILDWKKNPRADNEPEITCTDSYKLLNQLIGDVTSLDGGQEMTFKYSEYDTSSVVKFILDKIWEKVRKP